MQHARDRLRELTGRDRTLLTVDEVVHEMNLFVRGWAGCFRYGNSARHFEAISYYALRRLGRFIAKRHKRRAAWGWSVVTRPAAGRYGPINLQGCVVRTQARKGLAGEAERRR